MPDGCFWTSTNAAAQQAIQPGFAVTGHCAQGHTLPNVITDLSQGGFGAYVSASRPPTRYGLAITNPVTIDQLNAPLPPELTREIARLRILENSTYVRYGLHCRGNNDEPSKQLQSEAPQLITKSEKSKEKKDLHPLYEHSGAVKRRRVVALQKVFSLGADVCAFKERPSFDPKRTATAV